MAKGADIPVSGVRRQAGGRRLGALGADVAAVVALLAFWRATRLYSLPIQVVESAGLAASYAGTETLKAVFALAELAAVGAIALVPRVRRALGAAPALIACGVAATASAALMAGAFDPARTPGIALLAGDALAGALSAAVAVLAVAHAMACRPARRAVALLLASYVLFELVTSAASLADAYLTLTIALPAVSAGCLAVARGRGAGADDGGVTGDGGAAGVGRLARVRELPWRLVIAYLLPACFGSIAISAFVGMRIGSVSGLPATATSLALAGVVAVCALPALARGDGRTAEQLPLAALTFLLCLACLAIAANTRLRLVAPALDHAYMLALWVTLACACQRRHLPALACACAVTTPIVLLQYFAASDFVFNVGWLHRLAQATSPAALLACGALVAAMIACTVAGVRLTRHRRTDDGEQGLAELLDRAFRDTDLSDRERQIAGMLYRGLSTKRVAEEASLSPATVKSHATHIYRKLGVHSKQELIALVDEFRER